jgi:hypothetical protein
MSLNGKLHDGGVKDSHSAIPNYLHSRMGDCFWSSQPSSKSLSDFVISIVAIYKEIDVSYSDLLRFVQSDASANGRSGLLVLRESLAIIPTSLPSVSSSTCFDPKEEISQIALPTPPDGGFTPPPGTPTIS